MVRRGGVARRLQGCLLVFWCCAMQKIRRGATRSLLGSDRCCNWPSSAAKLTNLAKFIPLLFAC